MRPAGPELKRGGGGHMYEKIRAGVERSLPRTKGSLRRRRILSPIGSTQEGTMVPPAGTAAPQDLLVQHVAAWSRHDTEAILDTMTPDCVFETSGGPDPWGRRYEGQAAVREAIDE